MKNLIKAVNAVMSECKGIEKNSKVGSGQYAYDGTKDHDVKKVFNELMTKHGLAIFTKSIEPTTNIERWEETYNNNTKQKQQVFVEVKCTYLLCHESGESIEIQGYGHGVDAQDKAAGKATTYALKNALLYTFMTPVGKMDDTDTTHSEEIDVPKKKVWLTEEQFQKAMKAEPKQIESTLKYYSTDTHGMKKEYRAQLKEQLKPKK